MEEYFTIGQIVNTQGIKGEVRVYPLTDFPERYGKLKEVFLDLPTGMKEVKVEKTSYHKQFVILKIEGYDSCNDAEKLKNVYLKVKPEQAVKLPEGHYFIRDIIDLEVFTEEGDLLGKVTDVLQMTANDIYVVKNGEKEILIPAIKDVVKEINLADKKILIHLLEGLC